MLAIKKIAPGQYALRNSDDTEPNAETIAAFEVYLAKWLKPINSHLDHRLQVISLIVENWMDWDRKQRDKEGLSTEVDTAIMDLPAWPTHGMLTEWVKTLEEARTLLSGAKK